MNFLSNNNFFKTLLFASVIFTSQLFAQDKTTFSIETDPGTFAFSGYAFHARVTPAGWGHWELGAGIYSMEFPDLLVDTNPDNKDEGWSVTLDQGIGFFSNYFFNEENTGWFVGNQLAIQTYEVSNKSAGPGNASFTNLLIMPSGGYRWVPFKNGFYVQPWMGIGYTTKISGKTEVGSNSYEIAPILPFLTFHIGYKF